MDERRLFAEVAESGEGHVSLVRLEGVIDEDNPLQQMLASLSGQRIIISLSKVTRINSCGVRDWVRWLSVLESRSNSVYLVFAPPIFVNQINPVRNFCGERGVVVSFLGPYFCEACSHEHLEPLTTSTLSTHAGPPKVLCSSCGEEMVFDDVPETFFSFVTEHKRREVPPEVTRAIDKFDSAHVFTKLTELKELSPRPRGS